MAKVKTGISLSPSKVDCFLGCRRLFRYKYLQKPFIPPENRYFLIGNIAHGTLERLHKEDLQDPITNWKRAASKHFHDAAVAHNFNRKLRDGTINKDDMLSIKDMLRKYLLHLNDLPEMPKIQQLEKLSKIVINGIDVWLKADRIDRVGKDYYCVVDYKSGRPASKKDEVESVQIPSYGLLVRSLFGPKAKVDGMYLYLKHLDSRKGVSRHKITDEWIRATIEKYEFVNNEIKNGCEFKQNFKYKYCGRMCDFRRICVEDDDNGYKT